MKKKYVSAMVLAALLGAQCYAGGGRSVGCSGKSGE